MNENQGSRWEFGLKLLSPLLAVVAFFWGIYTYRDASQRQLAQAKADAQKTSETRRIEATHPYLDKQLTLYMDPGHGHPGDLDRPRRKWFGLNWRSMPKRNKTRWSRWHST